LTRLDGWRGGLLGQSLRQGCAGQRAGVSGLGAGHLLGANRLTACGLAPVPAAAWPAPVASAPPPCAPRRARRVPSPPSRRRRRTAARAPANRRRFPPSSPPPPTRPAHRLP